MRSSPAFSVARARPPSTAPASLHDPREPAERPLGQMERGVLVAAARGQLGAGNHHGAAREDDVHRRSGHARQIHDDHEAGGGVDDIHGWIALAGRAGCQ